jgi:hypothetical protein
MLRDCNIRFRNASRLCGTETQPRFYRRVLEIDHEHTKAIECLAALETERDSAKPKSERSFLSRLLHGQ